MTVEELQDLDDHIRLDSTGNRLLGLTMLAGEWGKDFLFQEQVYHLALRYGLSYPIEEGVN